MNWLSDPGSRLAGILTAILLILAFNAWFLSYNFNQVGEQERWVTHTMEVINDLESIFSSVKDAESGMRGWLLTDKEEHLEIYRKAVVATRDHLNQLAALTKDNHDQQANHVTLREIIDERFSLLKRFQDGGRNLMKTTPLLVGEGKSTMDSLRFHIDKMKMAEQGLLHTRSEAAERSKNYFNLALVLTTILSVLVIAGAFGQISRAQQVSIATARAKELEAREKSFIAEISKAMSGDLTAERAGEQILQYLSKTINALAGRIYMLEQGQLKLTASFGVKDPPATDKNGRAVLPPLVESAFRRDEIWEVRDVPSEYWHVASSLGESKPNVLAFVPFSFQGLTIGVMETGLFNALTDEQKGLLRGLRDTLGVGLNAAQSRAYLQALLEKTQQQSEELQAQQEELKTSNEELEQQARALESQQQALNIKNRELETTQGELERKATDLQLSSKYKSDFLARMSHELRTPLNGLLILSTLLIENKERNLTEQQRNFARSINGAGNDLLMLINDILDLSKIEAKKLKMRPETFTLQSLFDSKHRTFDPQMDSKGIKFITEIPDNMSGLNFFTDRQRLEQILRNFLSNALKFTAEGTITLKAEVEGERIRLSVTDTGIGIPREKQATIFEAFEQGDSSVSRRYGGTGLGLTISRELATLLGGDIRLTSEENRGSTFTLEIPLKLPAADTEAAPAAGTLRPASSARASEAPTAPARGPRDESVRGEVKAALSKVTENAKTILIVEDDDKFRTSVVEAVKQYGFTPIEAADGEVAMGILNEHVPSAILLDIKLPGISGLGILEMIKQMPHLRHVPVHMISALEYQHSALRMGALGYLTKPVTLEKVRSALGRIENLLSQKLRRVLLVEDDERQSQAIAELISGNDIEFVPVKTGRAAVEKLKATGFDCIILDLTLPDVSGFDLLQELSSLEISLPPIVIYTGKDLSDEEEAYLRRFSESIIIKGARSPERLLDEVNLFLHRVESLLPAEKREMLQTLRTQDKTLEGKTVLVVDDDIRNIFALTSALEGRGLHVKVARNGLEALEVVERESAIDLVVMDIMMPKMDGYEAMRRIRADKDPRVNRLPIVALTAKAMRDDHERCMEAGANDYLTKPVNLNNLTTVLKVWLTPEGFNA